MRSDHHVGTTCTEKGKTPIVKATARRFRTNMISTVNAKGHFRFMLDDGPVNGEGLAELLGRLIENLERRVFLVVDGHPSHKSVAVRRRHASMPPTNEALLA